MHLTMQTQISSESCMTPMHHAHCHILRSIMPLWKRKCWESFSGVKNLFIRSRENEKTEREAQGVGRNMLCPRKLFLDERKSLF